MHELPMISGDEYDALTRWRKNLHWHAKARRSTKRGYNRRCRRMASLNIRKECTVYYEDHRQSHRDPDTD